jgi:hypothetical protein
MRWPPARLRCVLPVQWPRCLQCGSHVFNLVVVQVQVRRKAAEQPRIFIFGLLDHHLLGNLERSQPQQ